MQAPDNAFFTTLATTLCLIAPLIPLGGALIWVLIAMRRGMANQNNAIRQVEESLILSRRTVEIAEESLKQREEIIKLLRELCSRSDPGKYQSAQP